jgi:hypothetical protein
VSTAPELDPYLLPLPAAHSPVVLPHLANSLHAHLNGRYADRTPGRADDGAAAHLGDEGGRR